MGSSTPAPRMSPLPISLILPIIASIAESKLALIETKDKNSDYKDYKDYKDYTDYKDYKGEDYSLKSEKEFCDNVPRGRPPIIFPAPPGHVKICLGDGPEGVSACPKLDRIE